MKFSKLKTCFDCPFHQVDEYQDSRRYCELLGYKYKRRVEISVNYDFPIICPLKKFTNQK